jgi:uncharacterized hydrophobic protein (TIGR00271 family)
VLHLQMRVPDHLADETVRLLTFDDTVTNVAVLTNGYVDPPGTLVIADLAREGANAVVAALRGLNVHHEGSIMLTEPSAVLSDAADDAERAAPGDPDDGVVWDLVENRVRTESALSWAFIAFLTLATLIAGAGRLLDEPILIIGAMVVGPEFSAVAAICVGLARPRLSIVPGALRTLLVGIACAVTVASVLWLLAGAVGLASGADASRGPQTNFIVQPDVWSFLIALLAGVAGVLALTTSKSGPLVGVFISVTTVPAIGTIALCIGLGVWSEVPGALTQLALNLAGMVMSGTATLLIQRGVWTHVQGSSRLAGFRGPPR